MRQRAGMADHYEKAREYLDEIEVKRADLADEYTERGGSRRDVIASLHQDIGCAMKLAGVHAALAQVQALHEYGIRQ